MFKQGIDIEQALEKEIVQKNTMVLRPQLNKTEVEEMVEKKKTGMFGTVFSRPKPEEIQVTSIELFYEPYWMVGGSYTGDYFRKNVYELKTDPSVKEVKIGENIFPVKKESSGWSKLKRGVTGGGNDSLEIPVEEHVEVDVEDEIVFNPQGNEVKLDFKIEAHNQENFPDKILKEQDDHVRKSFLKQEEVSDRLEKILKEDVEEDVKMLKEKISIYKLDQVFVPVYEARCVDPKNKVEILRIDAITKKIIG